MNLFVREEKGVKRVSSLAGMSQGRESVKRTPGPMYFEMRRGVPGS